MSKVYNLYDLSKKYLFEDIKKGNFIRMAHLMKSYLSYKTKKTPFTLMVETSTLCNLKCETCPTPLKLVKRPKKVMPFRDFKKIIDNSKSMVHNILLYWTNEPFTNREIDKFISYCKKNNLYTDLSTNVILMDEEVSKKILRVGLDKIILCLDGMSKDSFKNFRGQDSFGRVLKNIKAFMRVKRELKAPTFVEVQFIVNKFNQDEVEKIKKFCKEIRIHKLHMKTFGLCGYFYSPTERKKLLEKFVPTREDVVSRFSTEDHSLKIDTSSKCEYPKTTICVTVEGDVAICCFDFTSRYLYANLIKDDLNKILNSKKAKEIYRLGEGRRLSICKNCPYPGQ